MGNMFEVNGWDINEEIKDIFPNTTEVMSEKIEDNKILILDFNNPFIQEILQQGRSDEILSMCSQIIELKPYNEIAWLNKGNCLMKLKRYLEAIKHFEIAIEKRDTLIEAYYHKIECQYHLNKKNDAIQTFNSLIQVIPDNETIRLKKALFLNEINYKILAIEEFDKAIIINPLCSIAYYCKGNCLADLQKRKEALVSFDKAIELDNTNLNYLLRKAILLQESEEYKKTRDIKLQIENIINSSSFDSTKYNMNKITEAIKIINLMSHLISINDETELELKRKIYQGKISSFYEGIYKDKVVGVKIFPNKPNNIFNLLQKHCDLFDSNCSNKNVITIYKCEEEKNDNTIRVISEYFKRGNLLKMFKTNNNPPLLLRLEMIRQIANGMKYLIQNNITDVELDFNSILLDNNNNIKLCDIGINVFFKERIEQKQINAVQRLQTVIIGILKKPFVSLNSISLKSLENCLINNVSENIIHLIIEMYYEDFEQNGIIYYLNYLSNKSNY